LPNIFIDIETAPIYNSSEEFQSIQKKIDEGTITSDNRDYAIKQQYWKHERGGLNPLEGKIIMITYQVNDNRPWRLAEWKSSEKTILKELYDVISLHKGNQDDPLNIIGFNITNFDLPFLYHRSQETQIENGFRGYDPLWLYKYFHAPTIQDILQIHLPLNNWSRYGLNHNAVAMAYDLPTKEERGDVNAGYYYNQEFDKILKYTEDEFIYPQLYQKMKRKMVTKEKLQECVKLFQEKYAAERNEIHFQKELLGNTETKSVEKTK
jgi:hypothetical protein